MYEPSQHPPLPSGAPTPPGAGAASTQPDFYIRRTPPTYTHILIGINLVVFVLTIVYGYYAYGVWDGPMHESVLQDMGSKVNHLIMQGEYWRLLTAMFLHIGVFHLLINLYALYVLGPMVEGYFGHGRFLAIYFIGGLFGNLASYAFTPAPSAGASGAIFGLAGAITVYFLRYRNNFGRQGRAVLQNMLVVIVINLVFGMSMRGIDNWGHIGGLVGGAIVAWGVLPRYKTPAVVRLGPQELETEVRTTSEMIWVFAVAALLIAGVIFVTQRGAPTQF